MSQFEFKEELKTQVIELLTEYDYGYEESAIDKILDTWWENKKDLIASFARHDGFIKNRFLIPFELELTRQIDNRCIRDFADWVAYNCTDNLFCNEIRFVMRNIDEQFLDKNSWFFKAMEEHYPDLRIKEGQKVSRAVNKYLTHIGISKVEGYDKEFAKFSDAVNPAVNKVKAVVSLNPLDYLTMSFGNSWASCHTIDKNNRRRMPNSYEGCYSSGTMSYMLDSSTFVFYTVDKNYVGNDYMLQDKVMRQMFHYGHEKLVQGRLYPQGNDCGSRDLYKQIRTKIQGIVAAINDMENKWVNKKGTYECDCCIRSFGTHYRDYLNFDQCNVSYYKNLSDNSYINVGHAPICIVCGKEHDYQECIKCEDCDRSRCYSCDCAFDEDDLVEIDGHYYCYDCCEYCPDCHEYHLREDMTYLELYDRYVCDCCLDNYYTACTNCGEYIKTSEMTTDAYGNRYCEDCTVDCLVYCVTDDKYYRYDDDCVESCYDCGEYHLRKEMTIDKNGDWHCEDCVKENNIETLED